MIPSSKRMTKALIGLRGCAGWSASLLLANPRKQVLRDEAHILPAKAYIEKHGKLQRIP